MICNYIVACFSSGMKQTARVLCWLLSRWGWRGEVSGSFLRAGLWGSPLRGWLPSLSLLDFSWRDGRCLWGPWIRYGAAGCISLFHTLLPSARVALTVWFMLSFLLFLVYFLFYNCCSQHLTGVSECLACGPSVQGWLLWGDCWQFLWWESGVGAWHFGALALSSLPGWLRRSLHDFCPGLGDQNCLWHCLCFFM